MKKIILILTVLLVFLIPAVPVCSAAGAADGSFVVTVRIVDQDGYPMPDTPVSPALAQPGKTAAENWVVDNGVLATRQPLVINPVDEDVVIKITLLPTKQAAPLENLTLGFKRQNGDPLNQTTVYHATKSFPDEQTVLYHGKRTDANGEAVYRLVVGDHLFFAQDQMLDIQIKRGKQYYKLSLS